MQSGSSNTFSADGKDEKEDLTRSQGVTTALAHPGSVHEWMDDQGNSPGSQELEGGPGGPEEAQNVEEDNYFSVDLGEEFQGLNRSRSRQNMIQDQHERHGASDQRREREMELGGVRYTQDDGGYVDENAEYDDFEDIDDYEDDEAENEEIDDGIARTGEDLDDLWGTDDPAEQEDEGQYFDSTSHIPPVGAQLAGGYVMDEPTRQALIRGLLLWKPPFLSTTGRPYQKLPRERTNAWSRVRGFGWTPSGLSKVQDASNDESDYPESLEALEIYDPAHDEDWWFDAVTLRSMATNTSEETTSEGVQQLISGLEDLNARIAAPERPSIRPPPGLGFDDPVSSPQQPSGAAPLHNSRPSHDESPEEHDDIQSSQDKETVQPTLMNNSERPGGASTSAIFKSADVDLVRPMPTRQKEQPPESNAIADQPASSRSTVNQRQSFSPAGDNILWAASIMHNFHLRNPSAPLRSKLPLVYATPSGWKLSDGYAFWKYLGIPEVLTAPVEHVEEFVPFEKIIAASIKNDAVISDSASGLMEFLDMCHEFASKREDDGPNWTALSSLPKVYADKLVGEILPMARPEDRIFFGHHDLEDESRIIILFRFEMVQEKLYSRLLEREGL